MVYKNKKTGAVLSTEVELSGNWVPEKEPEKEPEETKKGGGKK